MRVSAFTCACTYCMAAIIGLIGLPLESESEAERDSDDVMPAVLEEVESERF